MTKKLTASRKPVLKKLPRGRAPRNKYGVAPKAMRTGADGIVYDSAGEMARHQFLKLMQKQGRIDGLILRQVTYPLAVNDILVCKYIADFVYKLPSGETVVEDFKGVMTSVASLKSKLFYACTGTKINIVKKPNEWHD